MWFKKLPLSGAMRDRIVEPNFVKNDGGPTNGALDNQQALQACMVSGMRDHCIAQMAFGFRRFFTHQVAHFRPIAFYFTCASHLETLLGAGVGFHFRHDKNDVC